MLTLSEAICKMTSMSAARMGIRDRGILKTGAYADILLFDPKQFRDHATFTEPAKLATDLDLSVINGKIAWENGRRTNNKCGINLRIFH